MKITIDAEALRRLVLVARCCPKSKTMPILEGMMLRASGESVAAECTDCDMWAIRKEPASVESEGEVIVAASFFADAVSALGDCGEIDIADDGKKITLSGAGRKYTMAHFGNTDDWPDRPPIKGNPFIARGIQDSIAMALKAVPAREPRLALNGVHFMLINEGLVVEATSGVFLVRSMIDDIEFPKKAKVDLVATKKFCAEVSERTGPISFLTSETHISAEGSEGENCEWKFISSLINSKYPLTQSGIPANPPFYMEFSRKEFVKEISRCRIACESKFKSFLLRSDGAADQVDAEAESFESGTYSGKIKGKSTFCGAIAFSAPQLLEALALCAAETIRLLIGKPNSPVLIEGVPGVTILVMPIRMKEIDEQDFRKRAEIEAGK